MPRTFSTTTEPSRPAFDAIQYSGDGQRLADDARTGGLVTVELELVEAASACSRAVPPPATMPSSTAARVADRASSMRCLTSLSSVSVAAPTLTTATPPESFARRSWSFSRSQSESVFSISALIWLIRPLMSSSEPAPSTMVVSSLVMTTLRARPSRSRWCSRA
jgi:hypothetical protein